MTRKFKFLLAFILSVTSLSWGEFLPGLVAQPAIPQPYEIGSLSSPEAVAVEGEVVYVTNLGTGVIAKASLKNGRLIEARFLPEQGRLDKPMGMLIVEGVLYVADLRRIVGFDLRTRKQVFELLIKEARNLNDLVRPGNLCGTHRCLLASDYYTNQIFRVDLEDRRYTVFASDIIGANGMVFDAARQSLYVAGLRPPSRSGEKPPYHGAIYRITAKPFTTERILDHGTFLDGLAFWKGRLYFSDWGSDFKQGWIASVRPEAPSVVSRESRLGIIGGPADFAISNDHNALIVPALLEDKVLIKSLEPDSSAAGAGHLTPSHPNIGSEQS